MQARAAIRKAVEDVKLGSGGRKRRWRIAQALLLMDVRTFG